MFDLHAIHSSAMDLAEQAFSEQKHGNQDEAIAMFNDALFLELQCAEYFTLGEDSEPSRSILYRSAASLAYNAENFALAEKLAYQGLVGFPPADIEEELKALLEDIKVARALADSHIEMGKNDLEVSLYGPMITYGGVPIETVIHKFASVQKLVHRTAERLLAPQSLARATPRRVQYSFPIYITEAKAGSFTVIMRIGNPIQDPLIDLSQAPSTEPIIEADQVVIELMECMRLFERDEQIQLQERINNDAYYTNFVGLAKQVAPDGEKVSSVIFSHHAEAASRSVALRRTKKAIARDNPDARNVEAPNIFVTPEVEALEATESRRSLKGFLHQANTPTAASAKSLLARGYGKIALQIEETGLDQEILVPLSLMKDVVQPYYEEHVEVLVRIERTRSGTTTFHLEEITSTTR